MNAFKSLCMFAAALSLAGCASAKVLSLDKTSEKGYVHFKVQADAYRLVCEPYQTYKKEGKTWVQSRSKYDELPFGKPGYFLDGDFVLNFDEPCSVQRCEHVKEEFGDTIPTKEFREVGQKSQPNSMKDSDGKTETVPVYQTFAFSDGTYKRVYKFYHNSSCTLAKTLEVPFDYKKQ